MQSGRMLIFGTGSGSETGSSRSVPVSDRRLLEQLFVRTEQAITAFAINNLTAP
jgi:hypothetical protein